MLGHYRRLLVRCLQTLVVTLMRCQTLLMQSKAYVLYKMRGDFVCSMFKGVKL